MFQNYCKMSSLKSKLIIKHIFPPQPKTSSQHDNGNIIYIRDTIFPEKNILHLIYKGPRYSGYHFLHTYTKLYESIDKYPIDQ